MSRFATARAFVGNPLKLHLIKINAEDAYIGNGLRNVLIGHARLQMAACASNMPAWVRFGLSTLRGMSAPA